MNTRNVILLGALLAASATAGYLFYESRETSQPETVAAGDVAPVLMRPVFALPDLAGVQRSITEWDGKALVVNFWATWCAPCLREIPVLLDMNDELVARDIQIVGIAMDDPDAVREFAGRTEFNYPVLIGEQEAIDAAEGFGVDVVGLPLTVFTDHAGRVLEVHAGEITRDELTAALARLPRNPR